MVDASKLKLLSSVPNPWHFGMDPDRDPRIFTLTNRSGSCSVRQWLSRHQQKWWFPLVFFAYYFFNVEGSKSVPPTNGSGSGRPNNLRIRLQIRNTAFEEQYLSVNRTRKRDNLRIATVCNGRCRYSTFKNVTWAKKICGKGEHLAIDTFNF